MQYTLPALPFEYSALEPYIDTETMRIHHDKHHQAYVDKLNSAFAMHPEISYPSVEDLLRNISAIPEDIRKVVQNHGGGHSNHGIFWTLLTPTKQEPSESLKSSLSSAFGSWESFVEEFNSAATTHFGSGWAWLIKTKEGKFEVKSYANQDSPYMDGSTPIFGIDVWEHAYYLKYQNKRADYISAFWNVINWIEVEKRML